MSWPPKLLEAIFLKSLNIAMLGAMLGNIKENNW
jgi:hypothetical protein